MKEENAANEQYKKKIFRLALFLGELMLKNGAETYRVEDSVLRICNSRGFKHVNAFVTPTVIIISDEKFDGITFMKTIKSRGMNLAKIDKLNSFSRRFVEDTTIDYKSGIKELREVEKIVEYTHFQTLVAAGIGCAAFALILNAGFLDFIFTVIVSIGTIEIFNRMNRLSSISVFPTLLSSLFLTICGILLKELNVLSTPNMLIVGSIMPLLPGVSFIKSIRDLISGDLMSGVARAFEVLVTVMAIAAGVGFTLDIWLKMGGVF